MFLMVQRCSIEHLYKLRWNLISILATYDLRQEKDILLVCLIGEVGLVIKVLNH